VCVFPDGRVILGPLPDGEDYIWPRVADIRFLLDQLPGLHASGPFAGRLDLERIGMFGASRGGYLSNISAVQDPRIRAAANMDGFLWGLWTQGTGLSEYPPEFQAKARALRTPILRLLGEQPDPASAQAKFEEESRDFGGDFISIEFQGWKHNGFSSEPLFCGVPKNWPPSSRPPVAAEENIRLQTDVHLAFFGHYLRGEGSRDSPDFPAGRITIRHRNIPGHE
jgi:hypothetical protein